MREKLTRKSSRKVFALTCQPLARRDIGRSTAVGVKPTNVINSRMFEPRDGRERISLSLPDPVMLGFCRRLTFGSDNKNAQGKNGHRDKFRFYRRFHDQGRSSDNFENLRFFEVV